MSCITTRTDFSVSTLKGGETVGSLMVEVEKFISSTIAGMEGEDAPAAY